MTSAAYALGSEVEAGKCAATGKSHRAALMLVSARLSARAQFDGTGGQCGQIAQSRQRAVNHVGGTKVRYIPLTSEIKPIPMPLWHVAGNVRTQKTSPAGSDL